MSARSVTAPPRPSGAVTAVVAVVVGLAVLGAGMLVVRDGRVPAAEESVFRAVNDLPGSLYPLLWPFQQVGAIVVGPIVALVALALGRRRLALAAAAVTVLKLVTERLVKAVVSRERPGTSIGPDIERRGDVHAAGASFVSGHAVLVAALAGVVTPYLPGRWKIAPWLLVAGVMVGRVYVGAHNPLDVVCGAALGVAVAGAVNLLTGAPGHRREAGEPAATSAHRDRGRVGPTPTARVRLLTTTSVAALAVAGCGAERTGPAPTALDDNVITVGSFDFAESVLVAEIYSQGLERAGYEVARAFSLGPREFVAPALAAGLVELVPEYAGTAAEFASLGHAVPSGDVATTHAELERALAGAPVVALAPAPAQDANTFVVDESTARRHGLASLSDLAAVAPGLVFGGPPECPTRQLCLIGLNEVYGARFAEFVALDAGGPLTRQALLDGSVDVALMFSTDPSLDELDLVALADDRGLQPAESITPIVRTELVQRWGPGLVGDVDAISARLTTPTVRELNRAVASGTDVATVVERWWAEVAS